MTETDYLPVWEPGDALPKWAEKLQEPFPVDEIGRRPQVWCKACRDSQFKYCGKKADDKGSGGVEHVAVKCKECGQKVTRAHLHLYYVGHAHATRRLLEVDPRWSWRPMAREVDAEVLKAAIASGDPAIVQMVINTFPPKITEIPTSSGVERIMWMEVVVHDENGGEVVYAGVGDAIGKVWGPNAVKEMIGDGIRNAGMRGGLALDLWAKFDLEQAQKEARQDSPDSYSARAGIFDDDAKADAEKAGQAARRTRQAKPDTGNGEAGINPEAQAAADLAFTLAATGDLAKLQAAHEDARKKRVLGLHCLNPANKDEKTTVLKVFAFARDQLEAQAKRATG